MNGFNFYKQGSFEAGWSLSRLYLGSSQILILKLISVLVMTSSTTVSLIFLPGIGMTQKCRERKYMFRDWRGFEKPNTPSLDSAPTRLNSCR